MSQITNFKLKKCIDLVTLNRNAKTSLARFENALK